MILKIVLKYLLVLSVFLGLLMAIDVEIVDGSESKKFQCNVISQHNVIISFDDNPSDYFSAIEPMTQYGYVGVACIIVNTASISILNSFVNSGWELASHSMTHPNLTSVNSEQLDYEVRQSKIVLEQEVPHCVPIFTFAYPYNNYNSKVEETVAKYYRYGRTASGAWNRTRIWDNLPTYEIPGLAIGPNNYKTDLPNALSSLQNDDGTLVLVFHAVGGERGLDMRMFIECLDDIKASGATVVTFKDLAQLARSHAPFFDGIDGFIEMRFNIVLRPQFPHAMQVWEVEQLTVDGRILWMGAAYQLICGNNGYVYVQR